MLIDRKGTGPSQAQFTVAPPGFRLPGDLTLGPVRLQVADLSRSVDYYRRVLGLRVLTSDGTRATLAASGDDSAAGRAERASERHAGTPPRPPRSLSLRSAPPRPRPPGPLVGAPRPPGRVRRHGRPPGQRGAVPHRSRWAGHRGVRRSSSLHLAHGWWSARDGERPARCGRPGPRRRRRAMERDAGGDLPGSRSSLRGRPGPGGRASTTPASGSTASSFGFPAHSFSPPGAITTISAPIPGPPARRCPPRAMPGCWNGPSGCPGGTTSVARPRPWRPRDTPSGPMALI